MCIYFLYRVHVYITYKYLLLFSEYLILARRRPAMRASRPRGRAEEYGSRDFRPSRNAFFRLVLRRPTVATGRARTRNRNTDPADRAQSGAAVVVCYDNTLGRRGCNRSDERVRGRGVMSRDTENLAIE